MSAAEDIWEVPVTGSSDINEAEVRNALGLLMDPGDTHEIRGLPSGQSRIVRRSRMDDAVSAVRSLSNNAGIYITLNPVSDSLEGAAKEHDIVCRRRLLIDVDTERPSSDSNATDAEKEASYHVALAIRDRLRNDGWPDPLVIDSGNGTHLIYAIELPTGKLSQQIVKGVLQRLAADHNTGAAKVDTKVHNAARITKLPGTWARKGPNTEDRPHRQSQIMSVPISLSPVAVELLQALAGVGSDPEPEPYAPPQDVWVMPVRAAGQSNEAYVRTALERECDEIAASADGGRNDRLNVAAFRLGQLLHLGADRHSVEASLCEAARLAGLGEVETKRTIRSGLDAGAKNPREPKQEDGRKPAATTQATAQTEPLKPIKAIIWASQVTPRKIDWLWPGRIPVGKMTTFAGQGGIGKTFVLCDIAARVTTETEWPFGNGECPKKGRVLFISGEDDLDDTLVPRLMECGADLTRVAFLTDEFQDTFSLVNLDNLSEVMEGMADVRLVVIDPPTAYLGDVDSHKDAELRGAVLGPLKRWAARHQVAVILNTHVNKATNPNVDAASRVMGSVAWVNAVRTAHMFIRDKDQSDKVLFVPFKVNITKKQKALAYRVVETRDELARVEWLCEVDTTADEALDRSARKAPAKGARELLIEMFRTQREWQGDAFWAHIRESGINRRTLEDVKAKLDIPRAKRRVGSNGDTTYVFWVPDDWEYLTTD